METLISGLIGAVIGAVTSGVFVIWATRWQVQAVFSQTRGEVHERLYNQNRTILQVIIEHPMTRPFFYEKKPLGECKDEEEKYRVMAIAEMFAGFHEQIAIHLPQLPDTVNDQWIKFIRDAYLLSPAIQQYYREYATWYSPELLKLLPD